MHKTFMGQLKILPKSRVFPVKNAMSGQANVELDLKIGNVSKSNVHGGRVGKIPKKTEYATLNPSPKRSQGLYNLPKLI